MENWFGEMESKQYELGIEFDQRLVAANPHMNASLPD